MAKSKKSQSAKPLQVHNPLVTQAYQLGLSREDVLLVFVLPNMRAMAQLLAMKDSNSTGADDEAASAITYALDRLENYLAVKKS